MRLQLTILFTAIIFALPAAQAQKNEYNKFLIGKWQSLDDPNSVEIYSAKEVTSQYKGKTLSKMTYRISYDARTKDYLLSHMDGTDADAMVYSIHNLDNNRLELTYLARGNTLRYKKISAAPPLMSSVMTVVVARAYFYSRPDIKSKRKAYIVKGQKVNITKLQGNFVYGNYTNDKGVATIAWLKKSDLK